MNIQEIRAKYQTILQDKEEQNQQSQWDQAYYTMKNKRKKKILTQISSNDINLRSTKGKTHNKKPSNQVILDLKEKLAQTFQNSQLKNSHIQLLKNQIKKKDEQIQSLLQKNESLHQQISKRDGIIEGQKKKYLNFQKQYESLSDKINATQIDNDLLKNQMEFYRKEIQALRFQISLKDKSLEMQALQFNKTNKVRKENQRLRDDIRRLHFLINGIQGFRGISTHLENKHFLGKPYKQFKQTQYWYPEGIIKEVEVFLKKEQIAYGNKQFTSSLVKFVNRFVNQVEKFTEKKVKKKCEQKVKQVQRRHNYSLNIQEVQDMTLKKSYRTLNHSQLYKTANLYQSRAHSIAISNKLKDSRMKNNHTNQPSRLITQSFVIDRLSKSLMNKQTNIKTIQNKIQSIKQACQQIIQSFKTAVQKLYSVKDKEIYMKKMKKLVNWLQESMKIVLQSQKLSKTKIQEML